MPLLVVAYPTISQDGFQWIQSVRASHDPQHRLIPPHFTLVFAVSDFDEPSFVEHVKRQLKGVQSIPFTLKIAILFKEMQGEETYVFLVPDRGFSDIAKLHDRLYEGNLAAHLRLDIPYIPHITIARNTDPQASKELADKLNGENFAIEGVLETLDVIRYKNGSVTTIERIEFV